MASSKKPTPTSSHFSIQFLLSPDNSEEPCTHSSIPPRAATPASRTACKDAIPPSSSSPTSRSSAPGFGPDSTAGPPPTSSSIAPQTPPRPSPLPPMPSREDSTPSQHQPPESPPSLPPSLPSSSQQDQEVYGPFNPQHHPLQPATTHPSTVAPTITGAARAGTGDSLEQGYASAQSPEDGCAASPTRAHGTPPATEGRKGPTSAKRAPMRSSIACARCRRSKIKCVNNGEGKAACETCLKSRRDCHYPPTSAPPPRQDADLQFVVNTPDALRAATAQKRDESGYPERQPDRKRPKKTDDASRLDEQTSGAFYADEVISAPFLTEAMWMDIFDIFRLHFLAELPFLHMPTLKDKMGDKFRASQTRRSADTNLVLLGVLTLTSRFHSDLVKYISYSIASQGSTRPRPLGSVKPDPWATSEYYADLLTKALGPLRPSMTLASAERVQAFLMLGLYEWSQSKTRSGGLSAWMYVGVAVRMAQALGLCSEPITPGRSQRWAAPTAEETPEGIVAHEIRRRTMFSCFILDRLLSCGKERLPAIRSEDLKIQLPCSDFAFDLAEKVQTRYLKPLRGPMGEEPDAGFGASHSNDSVLARFICLVDIWGEITKYSFSGGRHAETRPPWEDTEFRRLRRLLDSFYASLPTTFALSTSNYHKHDNHQASSTYVSLHMLGSVCKIMMHREYIPFIAVRCPRPMGPLDEPTFPEGSAPTGFWEESAECVFKAARDIVHLIEICDARNKVPMSALSVFSVWTAAFVGIYAWHFPQMDVHHHMAAEGGARHNDTKRQVGLSSDETSPVMRNGPTRVTYMALKTMCQWLQMASTNVRYFRFMDKYYEGVKKDYLQRIARHGSDMCGQTSERLGGDGGGLDEWRVHGPKVIENGSILMSDDALAEASEFAGASSTRTTQHAGNYEGEAGFGTSQSGVDNGDNSGGRTGRSGNNNHHNGGKENNFSPFGSGATPTEDRGQLPQGTTPASSFTLIDSGASSHGEQHGSDTTVPTSTAPFPYTIESDGQFPDGVISGTDSTTAAGAGNMLAHGAVPPAAEEQAMMPLPAEQGQPWESYAHYPGQRYGYRPLLPYAQAPAPAYPTPAVPTDASPPGGYYEELHAGGFTDMNVFYAGVAGVEQYVDQNQGRRWQDVGQAAGIELFSQVDSEGPAVWASPSYSQYLQSELDEEF